MLKLKTYNDYLHKLISNSKTSVCQNTKAYKRNKQKKKCQSRTTSNLELSFLTRPNIKSNANIKRISLFICHCRIKDTMIRQKIKPLKSKYQIPVFIFIFNWKQMTPRKDAWIIQQATFTQVRTWCVRFWPGMAQFLELFFFCSKYCHLILSLLHLGVERKRGK